MTDAGPLRSARRGWPRVTEGLARRERARSWARRRLSLRRGRGGGAAELSPPPAPARRSLPLDVARTFPSAMLTASAAPGRLRAGGGERERRRRRPGRGVSGAGQGLRGQRRARGAGDGRRRELGRAMRRRVLCGRRGGSPAPCAAWVWGAP